MFQAVHPHVIEGIECSQFLDVMEHVLRQVYDHSGEALCGVLPAYAAENQSFVTQAEMEGFTVKGAVSGVLALPIVEYSADEADAWRAGRGGVPESPAVHEHPDVVRQAHSDKLRHFC